MKKTGGYVILMLLLISSVVFAACAKSSVAVGKLNFSFDKTPACLISQEGTNYVKIDLEIQNKGSEKQSIAAADFALMGKQELGEVEVFFGNNVVDKQDSESLEAAAKVKLTLTFIASKKPSGTYELHYKSSRLVTFNL